jgi:hypothetical protein
MGAGTKTTLPTMSGNVKPEAIPVICGLVAAAVVVLLAAVSELTVLGILLPVVAAAVVAVIWFAEATGLRPH